MSDQKAQPADSARQPYITPVLSCHGRAQALTHFDVSNNKNDKGNGAFSKT